jgi:NAD kinase
MSEVGDPASADVVLALGDDRAVLDAVSLVGEGEVPILGVSTGGFRLPNLGEC